MKRTNLLGIFLASFAGIAWGFSGTCGQYLMQQKGVETLALASLRMFFAGMILIVISLFSAREDLITILKTPRHLLRTLVFSLGGVVFSIITYLKSILYSNAGTATVLQYVGLIMVMVVTCVKLKKLPDAVQLTALVLCIVGVFVSATHGSFTSLAMSPRALLWGLASAVSLVFYTLAPAPLLTQYSAIPVTGLAMLAGGLVLLPIGRPWQAEYGKDVSTYFALAGMILVGTVIAYTLYLQGVKMLGAVKGSLCACTEPVSAAVISAIWLKTDYTAMDLIGAAAIIGAVILLSVSDLTKIKNKS